MTPTNNGNNELVVRVTDFQTQAAFFEVKDAATFELANLRRQQAKALIKEIYETFDEIVETAKANLDVARAKRDQHLDPVEMANDLYKNKMLVWQKAEEKRIADEQEKQRKLAQARAEEERLNKALEAEKNGDSKKADRILETPIAAPPPPPPAMPKAKGFSARQDPDFVLEDAALLPREYLVPDLVKIRKVVRALGMEAKIPGVQVFMKDVAVGR